MTEDPLKVFLGGLLPGTTKPQVAELLARFGHSAMDIIMPPCPDDQVPVAFLCFLSTRQALEAIACYDGVTEQEWTGSSLKARRVNMGAYRIFSCLLFAF